jgi:hypothetical protein
MIARELHKLRCKHEVVASGTKDLSLAANTNYLVWLTELPGRNWRCGVSEDKKNCSIFMWKEERRGEEMFGRDLSTAENLFIAIL